MTTDTIYRKATPLLVPFADLASEHGAFELHTGRSTIDPYVLVTAPSPTRLTAAQGLELYHFLSEPRIARMLKQPHRASALDLKCWFDPNAGTSEAALILSPSRPGRLSLMELKVVRVIFDSTGLVPTLERLNRGETSRTGKRRALRELW